MGQQVQVPTQITVTVGVTHETGTSTTNDWSRDVTTVVATGFTCKFPGGSTANAGVTVTGTTSKSFSVTYHDTWTMKESITISITVPPGEVWQWVFTVTDSDGKKSTVKTRQYMFTNSIPEPPCCLPGFFTNVSQ